MALRIAIDTDRYRGFRAGFSPRVEVLYPREATTRQYAQLYLQLRRQGTPIPTNELWIAALTLENDLYLFSRGTHFDAPPQLPHAT